MLLIVSVLEVRKAGDEERLRKLRDEERWKEGTEALREEGLLERVDRRRLIRGGGKQVRILENKRMKNNKSWEEGVTEIKGEKVLYKKKHREIDQMHKSNGKVRVYMI